MVKISIPVQTVCFILCAIPHFHDDQWESPEKKRLAGCFISGLPCGQMCTIAFPAADAGCHGDTVFCGQLLSPALGCLGEPGILWRTVPVWSSKMGPSSFKRDGDEKEGGQAWEDPKDPQWEARGRRPATTSMGQL